MHSLFSPHIAGCVSWIVGCDAQINLCMANKLMNMKYMHLNLLQFGEYQESKVNSFYKSFIMNKLEIQK